MNKMNKKIPIPALEKKVISYLENEDESCMLHALLTLEQAPRSARVLLLLQEGLRVLSVLRGPLCPGSPVGVRVPGPPLRVTPTVFEAGAAGAGAEARGQRFLTPRGQSAVSGRARTSVPQPLTWFELGVPL